VHAGCPQVEEMLKWSMPHFVYQGILCNMAAFKSHCAFGFWRPGRAAGLRAGLPVPEAKAMGQFRRIATVSDLPGEKALLRMVKAVVAANAAGVKAPARARAVTKRVAPVPAYFMAVLRKDQKALATFEGFSPSHRRDYVEWVTEAKGDETRRRRLATAVAWLAAGKARDWKYLEK
jgi:uncharacterized protein YdeI (YjbR/CyaY-like superfamily)